jgi:hypothetical protein
MMFLEIKFEIATYRSASASPYAERMELYRWIRIVLMPSRRAISHACWPPAPPKLASLSSFNMDSVSIYFDSRNRRDAHMCLPVAYPLASVSARIGLHIVSFATLMNLYNAF